MNTLGSSNQDQPAMAFGPPELFVAVWTNNLESDGDTEPPSIRGKRYGNVHIFFDGFESVDTSAWARTVSGP